MTEQQKCLWHKRGGQQADGVGNQQADGVGN